MIAALAIIAAVGWLLWLREARANIEAASAPKSLAELHALDELRRVRAALANAEALAAASKEQLKQWAETLPGPKQEAPSDQQVALQAADARPGQWVAVFDGALLGAGESLADLLEQVRRKHPLAMPTVHRAEMLPGKDAR